MVALGWSAKKQILGKDVYNDSNQKIGIVDDLIIAPDNAVSFAIIGAGGFLGLGKHDVAIPVSQLKMERDTFILPGASKDRIKAMPEFKYGKQSCSGGAGRIDQAQRIAMRVVYALRK